MDAAPALPLTSVKPTPEFVVVFSEQLGLIGRSLWREGAMLGAGFVVLSIMVLWEIFNAGLKADFPIDAGLVLALGAFLLPFALWRGERLFDQGHLSTLPVERRWHILIRILAGGVWLFGVIAWVMLWLAAVGLISGSDMGIDRYLLLGHPGPAGEVTHDMVRRIHWTPATWNWIAAFTTGAVFYLLGTALVVGVRYWLRWSVALVGAVLLLILLPEEVGGVSELGEAIVEVLVTSPLGLDYVVSGGSSHLDKHILLPGAVEAYAWTGLPDMQGWLRATGLWLAVSAGLVGLAAWRHREW